MVKPSGTSGFFQVRANEQGDISGAFVPTPYSTEKAEIERQMVVSFISSMNKNLATSCEELFLSNPKQNQENNIDFTVDSPNGLAYLELMEIAPLKGPYTTASSSYKPYEFARLFLPESSKNRITMPRPKGETFSYSSTSRTGPSFPLHRLLLACVIGWLGNRTGSERYFRFIY
jgi:hypothetical protein